MLTFLLGVTVGVAAGAVLTVTVPAVYDWTEDKLAKLRKSWKNVE